MRLLAGALLSVTFLVSSPSCKKTNAAESLAKSEYKNESYGPEIAQKLDVFLPAGRTTANTKTIVFIHGGSWSGGDKADFTSGIEVLRNQLADFAIFNINYRLAGNPSHIHPAQINDVQTALDFIKNKSSEYHINPGKVVLIGVSAGAHLALLQAYKNNTDGRIKAVIDLFGPTDLISLYNNHPYTTQAQPVLLNYLGTTPSIGSDVYYQASPINYVNAQSVPTQIFHGDADPVVPLDQSSNLKAKLQSYKVKVEMTVYAGQGHGWFDNDLLDTYTRAVAFIRQNVP